MNITQKGNDLHLELAKSELNLADTLDCGQCFRFVKIDDTTITGVAYARVLTLVQTDNLIVMQDTTINEFNEIWKDYFDLSTDYKSLHTMLSQDETMEKALNYAGGIHILQQDSFEALVSFIISQNNNIPRIKGSINKLCRKFGSIITDDVFSFPTLSQLTGITKSDLADIGLGYRDDYIVDCVNKLNSGEIKLEDIKTMNIDDARQTLRKIKGVGPKVAECALLFGFYRVEAFPIDTWIKKAMQYFYPNGFPQEFHDFAGIAQQYLFHYVRTNKDLTDSIKQTA